MAIEIDTAYHDDSVVLEGDDARRFMDEVINPSDDERRIEHLRLSAEAADEFLSDRTANEILADIAQP